jgi:hypothetical protein
LGVIGPVPLGHKDVRGQPLIALQTPQRPYLVALHRGTLGEPSFAPRRKTGATWRDSIKTLEILHRNQTDPLPARN